MDDVSVEWYSTHIFILFDDSIEIFPGLQFESFNSKKVPKCTSEVTFHRKVGNEWLCFHQQFRILFSFALSFVYVFSHFWSHLQIVKAKYTEFVQKHQTETRFQVNWKIERKRKRQFQTDKPKIEHCEKTDHRKCVKWKR